MTNLNLNLYKVLFAVASSKNYAEASEKLNMSESNISNQINNLEKQLGVKIFYRDRNGIKLTEIGECLFKYVKTGINNFDYIERFIKEKSDISNATITIGCPSHIATYYLMDRIQKAKKDYPNLTINLYSIPSYKELLDKLKEHILDFVIIDVVPEDKSLDQKLLTNTNNIFVFNTPINILNVKELENYKYILNFDDSVSSKNLMKILLKNDIQIRIKDKYDSTELRVNAAKRGLGIAYVMKQAVINELDNKELFEIKVPFELPKVEISAVYIKNNLSEIDNIFIKKYLF